MRREMWFACALTGAVLFASGGTAQAQEVAAPPLPPLLLLQGGPGEGGPPEMFGEGMEFLGFGGLHGGKVVTGLPFSATASTKQTLADGNQITRTSNLYRDSQGRIRREVTLPGGSHSFVVISDPVAGKQYLLRPDQKVAFEMPSRGMKGLKGHAKGPGNREWKERGATDVQEQSINTAPPMNFGVNVEGTQFTRVIPAGQIGNTNEIKIVSQRWYSPDLQIVVMSTHSDPRFGTTTYTLTNIQRQDPPAALFAVPSDYTVKQGSPRGGKRRFRGGPPPADAPAPAPPPADQ
jgi:hypothetical protein